MRKIKIRWIEFIFLIVYFLFFMILCIWSASNWHSNVIVSYEKKLFPWLTISFGLNIIGFFRIKRTQSTNFTLWYIFCSYIFMFGHVYTDIFELETVLLWNPSVFFSEGEKFQGAVFALLSLTAICLGYFCSTDINVKIDKSLYERSIHNKNEAILGWTCFIIGFTCNLLNFIMVIGKTYASGSYLTYISASANIGLLDDFAYLLIPGVIYILCGRTLTKYKEITFISCVIGYLTLTMILSGSRKNQLFAILTICICYYGTRIEKKINIRRLFVISTIGVLFLNLIYIIRENRTELNTIVPLYLNSLVEMKFIKQILGETLTESGLTFYSVVSIIRCVPGVFPYECGMTILRTLPSALPIGWLLGEFLNKGASTYVINRYTGIPVGASIIGDLYWNFGCIGGILSSFAVGIIFSKISKMMYRGNEKEPIYYAVFYVLMIGLRAGFFEIFRPLVMVTVVPYIINILLKMKIKRV